MEGLLLLRFATLLSAHTGRTWGRSQGIGLLSAEALESHEKVFTETVPYVCFLPLSLNSSQLNLSVTCGEAGIRTLDTGLSPYNRLAGGCLQPTRPPLQLVDV